MVEIRLDAPRCDTYLSGLQGERMDTQCDMILRYMKEEGSITPLDALREFGCLRLGARIWDLKNLRGVRIKTEGEKTKNKYGKVVRYARYSLVAEGE